MSNDERFLIDSILPANRTHIITGPSGAGTTTLGLQMVDEWRREEDVFGYASHAAPFCFVACNLPLSDLRAQMRNLDIPTTGTAFPHLSLIGSRERDKRTFHNVLTLAKNRVPNLSLLFIDSLSSLCPGRITDDRVVDDFLDAMNTTAAEQGITILGTIRSSKARTGEGYLSPRERIIGSGAFSSATSSKFIIEPTKPSKPDDPNRVIWIIPRVGKPYMLTYVFNDNGRLERRAAYVPMPALDQWLDSIPAGSEVSCDECKKAYQQANISKSSFYDWADIQNDLGTFLRLSRGIYRKPDVN